jgi:predicted lipid carrier protein YhbT
MNSGANLALIRNPLLPAIVRKPVAWSPLPLKLKAIATAMNTIFATPLAEGQLDFLSRRVMNIFVTDAELGFSVRLDQGKLYAEGEVSEADLTIEGTVYTFLLLATREEDADTLFFRRQLKTSGDTELGLHVKNFLDGLDPESLPHYKIIDSIMRRSKSLADRVDSLHSPFQKPPAP